MIETRLPYQEEIVFTKSKVLVVIAALGAAVAAGVSRLNRRRKPTHGAPVKRPAPYRSGVGKN